MSYLKTVLLGLGVLMLLLTWQGAQADAPTVSHPAQKQLKEILPELRNTEAEHAGGAYIPGVGAVITMDLVRGPNSIKDRPPISGTRDWAIHLMRTFGPRLDKVPPQEIIAISIDFYDYAVVVYHQLVITSSAADIGNPSQYKIWLDGKPQEDLAGRAGWTMRFRS